MDIHTLRKSSKLDFGKMAEAFNQIADPQGGAKSYQDTRFWKLDADKAGNGTATIRFLPRVEGDELPWVKIFSHGFQGPTGKWYIENSLTTIGEDDPVGQLNSKLWNSTGDENSPARKQARAQKRKLNYISNILVVSDPKHPENEGKVFLFRYGKKIMDKIMDKARPTFEDEEPVNVFDLWEGADFKLRMKKVDRFPNYDDSKFMDMSAIADGDDKELQKVMDSCYKLSEFLDRKNFKSYEELSRKLAQVLNTEAAPPVSTASMREVDDSGEVVSPKRVEVRPQPKRVELSEDDEEDAMEYFKKIATED